VQLDLAMTGRSAVLCLVKLAWLACHALFQRFLLALAGTSYLLPGSTLVSGTYSTVFGHFSHVLAG